MTRVGRERGGPQPPTSILEELAHPVGDPGYPFGVVARPAIQLPVLGLFLTLGALSGAAAVALAVVGGPIGQRQDPAVAVAMFCGGISLALLGLVVGAGTEMVRQVRTSGWGRPAPRDSVPPVQLGTLRGVGYLVATCGVVIGVAALVIVFARLDLSPLAIVASGLAPALLVVVLALVLARRRRGGDVRR